MATPTTPAPRKGLFKRLSYKIADAEIKLERICVVTGNVEKLKSLAKKKKDLYSTLLDGWTPLQVAAFNQHEGVVLHLLSPLGLAGGSNCNAVDAESGCTVLHLLAWRGNADLVQCVVTKGNAGLNMRSLVNTAHKALVCHVRSCMYVCYGWYVYVRQIIPNLASSYLVVSFLVSII